MMPLPTNPEQEQVATRLAHHRGVTVQGPPGTGKTHTIANLVSHLVAHGKRVLVTSQKEQALTVLRDKMPEDLRPLCVSVLGGSSTSLAELDQSVQAIYERAVGLDRVAARREVDAYSAELDHVKREVQRLRDRIRTAAERERAVYDLGGAEHTPTTLAQYLAGTAEELGYIPDQVAGDGACPLAADELVALYSHAARLDPDDCVAGRLRIPNPDDLQASTQLAKWVADINDLADRLAGTERLLGDLRAIDRLGATGVDDLIAAVETAAERLAVLEAVWLETIRSEAAANPAFAATWRDHLKAWREGIEEITVWKGSLAGHRVGLPEAGLPTRETFDLLGELRDRMASGKGVSKMFARDLYRLRETCTVDEELPRTADDVELCITEARIRRRRYELVVRWNDEVARVGGPTIAADDTHPEFVLDRSVAAVADALDWEHDAWPRLREVLGNAGARTPERPSASDLRSIASTLRTAALRFRHQELDAYLRDLADALRRGAAQPDASPLWAALGDALTERRWSAWDAHRQEAARLLRLHPDITEFDRLAGCLRAAAPVWTERILSSRGDESTAGPVVLAPDAWRWRQADLWLADIINADDPADLQRQLEQKLTVVARLTADLASSSAWLAVAQNLTDAQRQGLTAWAQALKKVGKGTGKYAAKWRAEALSAMAKAQEAVPVWIMPAHRVVESFDPTTTMFDVVIVDESSQCDVFSLAALSIARKAVVVGDDKQISPQAVGTDQEAVHELISQHISDVPHANLLELTSSLYDVAKRTFPGVVMLKEHFRCLPEIIEFSNQLSYNGEILPLREEAPDPTWVPVVDVHVPDGYREVGIDTNPPEADVIVSQIVALCDDPRYDGKTFGVISMLGDGQAELIERRLIEALGEQEMERRRIRCGNAYHFQGDERDVMFISLVVAAGEGRRIGAMTKDSDRQRMNVAASRARDQIWCIRSVTSDELHSDDVRARFIRFCQNPGRVNEALTDLTDKCDSDFERDVLRQVLSRGYRVKVQHKVGRYRIDMVIEGRGRRLAVECDGDAFHGPDRWEADRNRQAVLERLGWNFFRVRGSAYYRDPDLALSALWDRLDQAGIRPGDDDPAPEPPTVIRAIPATPPTVEPADPTPSASGDDDLAERLASLEIEPATDMADAQAPGDGGPERRSGPAPISHAEVTSAPTSPHADAAAEEQHHAPVTPAEPDATAAVVEARPVATTKGLEPFVAWQPRRLPDPHTARLADLIGGLREIVAAEGPIVARRAYELYIRSTGGQRVGKALKHTLNRAAADAVRHGILDQIDNGEPGQVDKTLYMPKTAAVVMRTRGDRDLEDIPETEVAALAAQILAHYEWMEDEPLKRRLLDSYERSRLTANASAFLDRCIALARQTQD
jgi:very-short-patch-repair endonuclease